MGNNKLVASSNDSPVDSLHVETEPLLYRIRLPSCAGLQSEALLLPLQDGGSLNRPLRRDIYDTQVQPMGSAFRHVYGTKSF